MKKLTQYLIILTLLAFVSCAPNPDSARTEMASEEDAAPTNDQNANETVERKLIKEGHVEFETADLSAARKTIFEAVDKYKGYVSSDQEFKSPGRSSNTLTIRVPAVNFDKLLGDATKGVERFDSKEINVKDVTEEFLDVEARLKTKKQLELRFLDILKQAKNVTEILEIEKQIAELRSDIESIEGRLKYLQNRVSFSTLTMTFYESIPNETEFGNKFQNGFINGWENMIWFFVMLINIWPFILLAIGVVVGIRIYRKKRK